MNSYISMLLAAERAKNLQYDAEVDRYRRQARQARRAARAQRRHQATPGVVPDSYEDFLCQTAQSAMREPTATGRSRGQAVR